MGSSMPPSVLVSKASKLLFLGECLSKRDRYFELDYLRLGGLPEVENDGVTTWSNTVVPEQFKLHRNSVRAESVLKIRTVIDRRHSIRTECLSVATERTNRPIFWSVKTSRNFGSPSNSLQSIYYKVNCELCLTAMNKFLINMFQGQQ